MSSLGNDWNRDEVEALVADYLGMLASELRGEPFNKAERNRHLQKVIPRTRGSIERKHQNVSAVLFDLGLPWIDGYKPLGHRQLLLEEVVLAQLEVDRLGILRLAKSIAITEVVPKPALTDFSQVEVAAPEQESRTNYGNEDPPRRRPPNITDYLAIDACNRSLGRAGEEFALEFESRRLFDAGHKDLAGRVEHVAVTRGDGLGFDISSFEVSGAPRLIEVKTTSFGKLTPFYVSRNEVEESVTQAAVYRLYRLFNFRTRPQFFSLPGSLRATCQLKPEQFIARVG